MKPRAKTEFGDFQTPAPLARAVCALLLRHGIQADAVVEPTAGRGVFLAAAAQAFPSARLHGWDLNPEHLRHAAEMLASAGAAHRASLGVQDFFTHDWEGALRPLPGRLLVLGNPPWVTNAGVAVVNGTNLPAKVNFQGLRGIAALTGKANFDISEWMLIRLLQAVGHRPATLAMLCKTATARKVLRHAWQHGAGVADAKLYRIDAAQHFGAAVDACLLCLSTGTAGPAEADVFSGFDAVRPDSRLGLVGKELVSDLAAYRQLRHLEGLCPFRWRSGVKHDCAPVMELRPAADGRWMNGLGELLDLEGRYVYPLLKCSDLANGRLEPGRAVLIPQRHVGGDTAVIARLAPRTWHYLQSHTARFLARRSSIYKAAPPFALFGIGDYAFAPWKVAVSALHRTARFHAVGPAAGRPVFFDDTCYFLSFEDEQEARLVASLMNSDVCQRFLKALIFPGSKRPLTADLLQRLNLAEIAVEGGFASAWAELRSRTQPEQTSKQQLSLIMETPPDFRGSP